MKAHVLNSDGLIVNTIVVDNLEDMPWLNLIDAAIGGSIGWSYINGELIPPQSEDE